MHQNFLSTEVATCKIHIYDESSRTNRHRDEHIFIFLNYRVLELKNKARAFFSSSNYSSIRHSPIFCQSLVDVRLQNDVSVMK